MTWLGCAGHVLDYDDTYSPGPGARERARRAGRAPARRGARARPRRRARRLRGGVRDHRRAGAGRPPRALRAAAGTRPPSAAPRAPRSRPRGCSGLAETRTERRRSRSHCCAPAACAPRSAPTARRCRSGWRPPPACRPRASRRRAPACRSTAVGARAGRVRAGLRRRRGRRRQRDARRHRELDQGLPVLPRHAQRDRGGARSCATAAPAPRRVTVTVHPVARAAAVARRRRRRPAGEVLDPLPGRVRAAATARPAWPTSTRSTRRRAHSRAVSRCAPTRGYPRWAHGSRSTATRRRVVDDPLGSPARPMDARLLAAKVTALAGDRPRRRARRPLGAGGRGPRGRRAALSGGR